MNLYLSAQQKSEYQRNYRNFEDQYSKGEAANQALKQAKASRIWIVGIIALFFSMHSEFYLGFAAALTAALAMGDLGVIALFADPDLLLLDEPTNHLDPDAKGRMLSLVAALEYTIFIWAVLLGVVFFAEIPSVNVWIGVAIIALAGIYTTTRKPAAQ